MKDPFSLEAKYYDKIWGSTRNPELYEEQALFLHRILEEHKAGRVLDLACGTGGHCLELTKLGHEVVGLDISQAMLERAKQKLSEARLKADFVLSDIRETYSSLEREKTALPFDAAICMGYSLAHVLDDRSLEKTLEEARRILRKNGVFIFLVRNAKHLRDDLMGQLRMDTLIDEPGLQLALLCYNYRDDNNSDVLVWNTLWLINDHGKTDFQVRTHRLRWFRYGHLRQVLEDHNFSVLSTYGDALGREEFEQDMHDTILMVCRKR